MKIANCVAAIGVGALVGCFGTLCFQSTSFASNNEYKLLQGFTGLTITIGDESRLIEHVFTATDGSKQTLQYKDLKTGTEHYATAREFDDWRYGNQSRALCDAMVDKMNVHGSYYCY